MMSKLPYNCIQLLCGFSLQLGPGVEGVSEYPFSQAVCFSMWTTSGPVHLQKTAWLHFSLHTGPERQNQSVRLKLIRDRLSVVQCHFYHTLLVRLSDKARPAVRERKVNCTCRWQQLHLPMVTTTWPMTQRDCQQESGGASSTLDISELVL